jgi:predicted transcriptional regulator
MPTPYTIMKSFFGRFKRRFQKKHHPDPAMEIMLQSLVRTEEREISCDEVYAVLDQFAEAAARGENVLLLMPLVRQHLDMCPDCREEYETLLRILQPIAQ